MRPTHKGLTISDHVNILRRDDFRCQECGLAADAGTGRQELQIHHRIPRVLGGTHEPDNLVTLCGACHKTADRKALREHNQEVQRQRREEGPKQLVTVPGATYSVRDAANLLGVSRQRVNAMITAGRLTAVRYGKIWLIEAAALIAVESRPAGYPKGRPRH